MCQGEHTKKTTTEMETTLPPLEAPATAPTTRCSLNMFDLQEMASRVMRDLSAGP